MAAAARPAFPGGMYRRILVALDQQGRAESVLPVVAALARRSLAEVVLVCVGDAEASTAPAAAAAAAAVERLEREGVRARAEVLSTQARPVAAVIADAARRLGADLVALGSRGRGDLAGLLLGSVGHRVAARLDCPILLVHDGRREDGTRPIRSVLLAVDDAEESASAVQAGGRLTREHDADAPVVHALARETIQKQGFGTAWDAASTLVGRAGEQLERPGTAVEALLLPGSGPVAARLASAAERFGADVIVVGSRRLTDLGGLLLGSVAHDLVRRTHRPVLLAERHGAAA